MRNLMFFELKRVIKNKTFILSTILISLVLVGLTFIPQLLSIKNISLENSSNISYDYNKKNFSKNKIYFENKFENQEDLVSLMGLEDKDILKSEEDLKKEVEEGIINRGIVFKGVSEYEVIVKNNNLFNSSDDVVALLENYNFNQYLKANDIKPDILNYSKDYNITGTVNSLEGRGNSGYIVDVLIIIMFYGLILFYGSIIASRIVQDKRKGIYEIVSRFTNSFIMTASKIFAYCIAGVFQFIVFATTVIIGLNINKELYVSEGFKSVGSVNIVSLLVYLLFIVFGFIFYLSLYTVFANFTKQEDKVSSVSVPILLILMFIIIATFVGVNYIDGQFMYIMSMIPFSSVIVAPLKFSMTNMGLINIITSLAILIATNVVLIIIASQINKKRLFIKR